MPTRLGDTLRAAETWPAAKYGLDPVKCWPQLWLVLPDTARSQLVEAYAALELSATAWLWGALFCAWTLSAWWALPIGVAVAALAYYVWMLAAASAYGDLVEAAFDVHRAALYTSVRWPLPASPAVERAVGETLTRYLWRGTSPSTLSFTGGGQAVPDGHLSAPHPPPGPAGHVPTRGEQQ